MTKALESAAALGPARAGMSVVGTTVLGMTAPMDHAGNIAAVLRGTVLQGRPVEEGLGGTFLVGEVDPARLLEAWQAAHAVVPDTGRRPVFTLPGALHHEPDSAELLELDRAARTLDPWSVYKRSAGDEPQDQWDVESYVQAFLGLTWSPRLSSS